MKIKKGALHKQLGYPEKEKIPTKVLDKIEKKPIGSEVMVNGKERPVTRLLKERVVFAKNFRGKRK